MKKSTVKSTKGKSTRQKSSVSRDPSKVDEAIKSQKSRYDEEPADVEAESVVQGLNDSPSEKGGQLQEEVDLIQLDDNEGESVRGPIEEDPEPIQDDLEIKDHITKDTKGTNLQYLEGDLNKSMAMTEKMKPQGTEENFFDKNNENFEKYTDVNQLKEERSEMGNLGFMDDEEIQPKENLNNQIKVVQESWKLVGEKVGLSKTGQVLFRHIFKIAPATIQLFPFKDEPDPYKSKSYKSHSLKVVSALGNAVAGLSDLDAVIPILKGLGIRHKKYGILPEHYPVVKEALQRTLKAALKESYTKKVKESWNEIFQIVQDTMISDIYEVDDDDMALTSNRVAIVQQTWNMIIGSQKDYHKGNALFKSLNVIQPNAIKMFAYKDVQNFYQSEELEIHAKDIVRVLDQAIECLNDLEQAGSKLRVHGKKILKDNLEESQFDTLCETLCMFLEQQLGDEWTAETKKAWRCAIHVMRQQIKEMDEADDILIQEEVNRNVDKLNDDTLNETIRQDEDSMRALIPGEDDLPAPSRKKGSPESNLGSNIEIENNPEETQQNNGEMQDQVQSEIKNHYLKVFRKEVDFHHKVAYRFEKAYRLNKKMSERRQLLNLEIIDCISEHSGYIEQDPMALFYCLFFCIYYKNEDLVEFLRALIHKIASVEKIDRLLEYIDINSIDRIRTVGEPINSLVYHMVFYQAVDDDLRIVYSQIFRQLRFIQLRDKDALQFLNQRDYELIKLSFEKHTTKVNLLQFYKKAFSLKASTYRKYNQAYYEEIVINNEIEARVAQNYRERFLVTAEDIGVVFEMYCKEDYDEQFQQTKKDEITHKQFVDLFITCLKNDSFKIASLIYTLYLNPSVDMDQRMMDILMMTIRESCKFHEIKLFFLHEHFDVLSISQLNQLVDIYQEIVHSKDPKSNPIISQFNTIKIVMLIYRICWKIEQKQIYSLITKCSLLQTYLIKSLSSYFEKQNNILVLYRLMSEPILHMTEKKDSLDIMYEMNMQELLKHPVVVEVLNLVYEGKYSVSSTALSMSQTFQCMLEMETMSLKSVNERLIANIVNFGDTGSSKQTSLQYNIWKQSIQQREQDEMVFTTLMSGILIVLSILINQVLNNSHEFTVKFFQQSFGQRTSLLLNAKTEVLAEFCPGEVAHLLQEYEILRIFAFCMILNTVGMCTSVIQKLVAYRFKDNVSLNYTQIILELSIFVVGVTFLTLWSGNNNNQLISETCKPYLEINDEQIYIINLVYSMRNPRDGDLNFKYIVSVTIIQASTMTILMLQRTKYLGELIMMLNQMQAELLRFFATFGAIIGLFLLIGRMLGSVLKYEHASLFQVFLDLFNAFNGKQDFEEFTMPVGQTFIATFMYLFKVLLMSLLAAMFINKYKQVWKNLDAFRRFNIIKQKNIVSYDKYIGGATLTFFPINIVMLPFIIPIVLLRSYRLSDTFLKVQYVIMMAIYCLLAGLLLIPMTPLLYCKILTNSIFIAMTNKREDWKGQNAVQLMIALFFAPLIISLSIVIDILSLPNTLLKDSRGFEHKYQLSTDRLNDVQIDVVMLTFKKIFYGQNFQNYKGKHMTLMELMMMHRRIFSIVDNMHDLTCRGNKDYKQALSNVQDYNMTKILTRKCAVPDKNGDSKQSRCELDVIYNVQMDIEIYNYIDIILRKLKKGTLAAEMEAKANSTSANGENDNAEAEEAAAAEAAAGDEEDEETKKVDGIFAIGIGPDGIPLKRNNSDVMNNFFIQFVVLSFTDIEKDLKDLQNNGELKRMQKFTKVIENRKKDWKNLTVGTFGEQASKYDRFLRKELKSLPYQNSEDPQNQHDMKKSSTTGSNSKGSLHKKSTMKSDAKKSNLNTNAQTQKSNTTVMR